MNNKEDFRIGASSVDGLDDASLAWAVIEPLWDSVDLSKAKAVLTLLSHVTPGQRALIAVDLCQKEVRNGGFRQFLENNTGLLAEEALKGFRLIGAHPYGDLLEKVLAIFPRGQVPINRSARMKLLRAVPEGRRFQLFDSLDEQFYGLLGSSENDLEKFRAKYVRTHPDEFFR